MHWETWETQKPKKNIRNKYHLNDFSNVCLPAYYLLHLFLNTLFKDKQIVTQSLINYENVDD